MITEAISEVEAQRVVRERERKLLTGIPTSSWYQLMQRGLAPKPVPLGPRSVGWVLGELLAFNAARIAARDKAATP
jgi:prophage regulatory protein